MTVLVAIAYLTGFCLAMRLLRGAWMLGWGMKLTLAAMWPAWPVICAGVWLREEWRRR